MTGKIIMGPAEALMGAPGASGSEDDLLAEIRHEAEAAGYTVSNYHENGYMGIRAHAARCPG